MSKTNDALPGQRPTLNPYRHAFGELWRRLKWDLHPQSWVSRAKLRQLRNQYAGQKAVIVCNGPSLLKSDLTLLDGIYTFGLNKINLLFDKSSFRPSCIVAVNPFVIEQNAQFFNETNIPLFIAGYGTKHVRPRKNTTFLHSCGQQNFARDCSVSIYQGYTVTFVAMQLAFHMGFKEVALIGCDHDFAVKGPPNKTVISTERDDSHFDPNYFSGGVKWQLPDLLQSEISYVLAKETYEAAERRIVNATVGGRLEIFFRMSLESFVR